MERESVKQLKDTFHEHPLVFSEKPWDRSRIIVCSACEDLLSGETYSCADCKFHLHKRCAEAPLQIDHLHRQHQLLTLQESKFHRCAICLRRKVCNLGYGCSSCDIFIDIKCALFTLCHGHEISHDSHNHPLLFIENHSNEFEGICCSVCRCELLGAVYVCTTCSFYIHKSCIDELPVEIRHPCHRLTSLSLDRNESGTRRRYGCDLCGNESSGYSYRCSSCDLDIHPNCAWPSLVVEDKSHHEHPFNLLWKQDPFICNACGTEGKHLSYVCLTCNLQVHKNCTSLPRFIRFIRHRHPLSHNYFVENMAHENLECRVCYDEMNAKHGSYTCLKQNCDYVVHVKCAIVKDSYYEVNSDEVKDLLKDKPVDSSITCVIEVNASGEAVKIKHFLHEHDLMLEDKIKDGDDKQCDGCTESISASFYCCSQCNFLLHKSCAELPRTWDGWWVAFLFTLKSNGIFKCDFCEHRCNGFAYNYEVKNIVLCLRCARISDPFEYSGHEHFLFFDEEYSGKCAGCGRNRNYDLAYRCKHDDVALDVRCMTLPHSARHKCDKHLLWLTYREESENPIQHYCDICEKKRDPNHWFYLCSICNNSAHPRCILGKYPYMKIGSKYEEKDHAHPLTFIQKIYDYPKCAKCGERCLDLSLECATCNYIVHWKCVTPIDSDSDSDFDLDSDSD